jgi:uncharacterized coiled-coil protein SlyX
MTDLVDVEIKLTYQDRAIEALSEALIEKEKRIASLEESVARIERAMTILASRTTTTASDVAGAHPEEDPVPRSG